MADKKQQTKPKKVSKGRGETKSSNIDYKNVAVLSKYIGRRYSILPKRYTKLSSKMQRKLTREVKKARQMALLKYTDRH